MATATATANSKRRDEQESVLDEESKDALDASQTGSADNRRGGRYDSGRVR